MVEIEEDPQATTLCFDRQEGRIGKRLTFELHRVNMDSFGALKQFIFGPCREAQHHGRKGQTIRLFQFGCQSFIDSNLTGIHALIVGDMRKVMSPNRSLSRFKGLSAGSTNTVAFLATWHFGNVHDLP